MQPGLYDDLSIGSELSADALGQRSGARVLGWLLLAAVIFGGVGVVLYVAMGEQGARTEREGAAAAGLKALDATGSGQGGAADAGVDPDRPDKIGGKPDGKDDGTGIPDRRDDRPDKKDDRPRRDDKKDDRPDKKDDRRDDKKDPKKDPTAVATVIEGVPKNAADAKALLVHAQSKLKAAAWADAYDCFSRLSKSSFLRQQAYLGLAQAAWQQSQVDLAIQHAQAAVRAGAGDAAKTILGHAYFKKGNYRQALIYYDEVLKSDPNNKEVKTSAKAAAERLNRP